MKDKTTQKTEDDVLDQTFANDQTFESFDEEMTAQTKDQTQEPTKTEKKKSSSNTMLFVGCGVAALGIIGWTFAIKPMLSQPAPIQQSASIVPLPAQAPATTPVAVAPPVSPERQVAQDFLTGNNSVAVTPVAPTDVQVGTNNVVNNNGVNPSINPTPTTTVSVVAPPNTQTTVSIPVQSGVNTNPANSNVTPNMGVNPVVSNSNSSSAVVEELSRRFDSQSQQLKISLDDVGTRVSGLEKFKDEQLSVNKSVDDRLTKLEGGKVVRVIKPVASNSSNSNLSNVSSSVNHNTVKKPVVVAKITKTKESNSSTSSTSNNVNASNNANILVDKTEVKAVKKEVPEYNFHSVYGGRVWLKNADGSLSTFTSGDRLPGGEVIKSVDDEKFSVVTDKRTIHKK